MEQLRRQSAQPESLKKFLGTENTLFDLENKNIYRGFKQKFRSRKFPFRLRKDRNNRKNTKIIERWPSKLAKENKPKINKQKMV